MQHFFKKYLLKNLKKKNGNVNTTSRRLSNKTYRSYRQMQEYSICFFYEIPRNIIIYMCFLF